MSQTDDDRRFMARAIELAEAQLGQTAPNPPVGCVLVKDGRVLAEAATSRGGRPHAEEQAIPSAGESARGATAYVTMEPCGARSSGRLSCAQRLIDAGVNRVVVACEDPSPFAAGRGVEKLRAAGLEVELGVMAQEASVLAEGYLNRLRTGLPLVRISPDGQGFDARFAAAPQADLEAELRRLGEAGYMRVWVPDGALAQALEIKGLLAR
ncbi:bifunctional diaminohydroxyphosphoribosylaminopyrimidine deaminase/5-amino-6-(5-phosphoribosylamino)uracil reductase RibD [Brevundimonas sp.]|uniref:bifunctional diaminohydroxyphosphoribosylaminopyrimidine deaminase/5-amino-6-(5-phosphoribosylamino)uracil reductase RibD n=1 Tax=Brevundimonas sp. TaxID=1871086 RepID=UPI0025D2AB0A|nr:bifunctional diaminohydroxyphosphoribosylaminopyrimidine deaminase/5-amino-6-(5-phosphoribosylamino)uracil reductase RibD [Brevundimonas sp.]